MDEHATWHGYDTMVSRKLERLYSTTGGGSIDVEICGRRYEIDVTSMQQVNKDTRVARKIQRCAQSLSTEATLPTATAAASGSLSKRSSRASQGVNSKKRSSTKSTKGLYNICSMEISTFVYS